MDFGIGIATTSDSWKLAQRAEGLGFTHEPDRHRDHSRPGTGDRRLGADQTPLRLIGETNNLEISAVFRHSRESGNLGPRVSAVALDPRVRACERIADLLDWRSASFKTAASQLPQVKEFS